jgi:hypothetical protein
VSDIKEIATWERPLYLWTVVDCFSRWKMGATWRCANPAVLAGDTLHLR